MKNVKTQENLHEKLQKLKKTYKTLQIIRKIYKEKTGETTRTFAKQLQNINNICKQICTKSRTSAKTIAKQKKTKNAN